MTWVKNESEEGGKTRGIKVFWWLLWDFLMPHYPLKKEHTKETNKTKEKNESSPFPPQSEKIKYKTAGRILILYGVHA